MTFSKEDIKDLAQFIFGRPPKSIKMTEFTISQASGTTWSAEDGIYYFGRLFGHVAYQSADGNSDDGLQFYDVDAGNIVWQVSNTMNVANQSLPLINERETSNCLWSFVDFIETATGDYFNFTGYEISI